MAAVLKSLFIEDENEVNFDSFINFPISCFKLIFFSFVRPERSASIREKLFYNIRLTYFRVLMVLFVLCLALIIAYAVIEAEDFVNATMVIPDAATTILIIMKSFITYWRRDEIWEICEELGILSNGRSATDITKYGIANHLKEYLRGMRIFTVMYASVFGPFVLQIIAYLIYGKRELMVKYWFPFDEYDPGNYPFALLFSAVMNWNYITFFVSTDSMMYTLMTVLAMEFDILRIDFMNLGASDVVEMKEKMKNLIKHHLRLLNYADKLQEIYGVLLLYDFVIGSMMICVLAFQFLIAKGLFTSVYIASYLSVIFCRIFFLCYKGQKVADNSSEIVQGVYFSGWENFTDIKLNKQMLLIMIRSQRPKFLTALGFADVSLENFSKCKLTRIKNLLNKSADYY
ncbi:CLUMA_CG010282, isoform A [Clunio marinus]|uniref:Odorant receptor n=1 Tax=Clunio marinus TaxID=568069 RepID=A0A1J1I9B6_9DIPT|nr:CLUMA_CG010282, isoform A [Clunio marinus]